MTTAASPASDFAERDYFTDHGVLRDPYAYFEAQRAKGPVSRMPGREITLVTGFPEAVEVLLDTATFSSCLNPDPLAPMRFDYDADDLTDRIEATQGTGPMDLMVAYDGDLHTAARSLLNPLFKPSRLKANALFMRGYAQQLVGEVVAQGSCELISTIATPFVTMVIADLLGVPAEDRDAFREAIDANSVAPGSMDEGEQQAPQVSSSLLFMAGFFARYVKDRRENPRDDVLTELALGTYPDGTTPPEFEVVKTAMFLFAAGQDTSAKLLGNSIRHLCEDQALQQSLREDRALIGPFLEEMLRLEGSTKATFRLAKRSARIGDVEVQPGARIVVGLAAANRDPRRWDAPAEFRLNRPRIKEHLAFGRGAHTCAGAPLARAEVEVLLDHLLDHTSAITLSEEHHGPPGARRFDYEPSYIIRGLDRLHVRFEPA